MLSMEEIADRINLPLSSWPGNCYAIACQILEQGIVSGRAVYGHYLGEIAETSYFNYAIGTGFVRHGWISAEDGSIIDPTRWVFDSVEPYLHVTKGDDPAYDEGGNTLLIKLMRPTPEHNSECPSRRLIEGSGDRYLAGSMLQRKGPQEALTMDEAHWLATLPLQLLSANAIPVYMLLCKLGWKALIPYDNYQKIRAQSQQKGVPGLLP